MKYLFVISVLAFGWCANASLADEDPYKKPLDRQNVLTWPRADLATFGCFLEKEFSYRDKRFNCNLKDYENQGDPCEKTDVYYEGISFPQDKAALINPNFERIDLAWENGSLQALTITFKTPLEEKNLWRMLGQDHPLQPSTAPYENITSISVQSDHILLQGFDHMGAGDVECPASE